MNNKENPTKEDAIYFLDMIGSTKSPNYSIGKSKRAFYQRTPFYDLLKNKHSSEYSRFITVYNSMNYVLSERECLVLDYTYGNNKNCLTLKQISDILTVTPERIRQIRNKAQRKMSWEINKKYLG